MLRGIRSGAQEQNKLEIDLALRTLEAWVFSCTFLFLSYSTCFHSLSNIVLWTLDANEED